MTEPQFVDPLLSAPMVEKEYAFDRFSSTENSNSGVEEQGNYSTQGESAEHGEQAKEGTQTSNEATPDSSSSTSPVNPQPPAQPINGGQSSIPSMSFIDDDDDIPSTNSMDGEGQSQGNEEPDGFDVPDEQAELGAEMLADIICDLHQHELPKILRKTSAIPTQNIQVAESIGRIGEGTTKLIEELNEQNKAKLKVSNEDRKRIHKPLVQVLKVNNLSVSPSSALILALVISSIGLFMTWREIKKQNDNLVSSILERAMTK